MSDQPSLFADAPVVERRDRLFLAIFPDSAVALRIVRTAEELRMARGLTAPIQDPSRMHVTLHHLGDFAGVPQDVVAKASAAAASVRCAPFEAAFDFAQSFRGPAGKLPFVLQGAENGPLKAFQKKLGDALAKHLLPPDATFTPHVTLLRDRVLVEEPQPISPIRWMVREFVLVHSMLGKTKHIPLARWPLVG